MNHLEFERPITELEAKIADLARLAETLGTASLEAELEAMRARADELRRNTFKSLNAWQKTQVARHPGRPHCVDYLAGLIDEFVELRGDRSFGDDQTVIGGLGRFRGRPIVAVGIEKGHDTATRLKHNFGAARPEGYRKAVRLMDLAERFNLPVISFADTAGAYPGAASEERGVAEAIARSIERGLSLGVANVAVITGEGGSGGALALAAANKVLMLEHSVYSVISPEGANSILWRGARTPGEAASAMKITAQDLLKLNVVDRIVAEPSGGGHADPETTIRSVGDAVEAELRGLDGLSAEDLRRQRRDRFYAIGRLA
ncbi:MAG: acetyl-CoA carboxylase carboxyl transferase subunit alpha [Phenylobacterium sp.]|uniref:acetyl-CoA carboxylase carboxyltransferase subunit alpha n=1 Tax=Phenylobacterium sp. TaxID=1871053 RepID=UPI0025F8B6E4|nr:acetyl-CoA carboxylase carboxyltransferase subunit alpha [Phenylobacterium sp.]MBA4012530.1 acetyl-CoA carboxylase carboxyl transferase subunit alpha [Phenylobacterium sp.]